MGKVRKVTLGDEESEKESRRKAEARRQTKASKKTKATPVEVADITPDAKKLIEEVEQVPSKDKKQKKIKAKVRSKRYQEVIKMIDKTKLYALKDAVSLVKQTSLTKFDGTVELHVNLNPLALGEKKDFRTSVTLPHSTGKEVNVVIADDSVIKQIEDGNITFDILVAAPNMMPKLAKVAKILGPKGLMPNPKTGTVGPDPERLALSLSKGQVNIKTEPNNPIIHMRVGKVSFNDKQIIENVKAVLAAVGTKAARVTLASTMGPGVKVAIS